MKRLGATPEQIAEAQAALAAQDKAAAQHEQFGVWDENWPAFTLFCSLETQWEREYLTKSQHSPMGASSTYTEVRRVCLPSERVESHARLLGIPRREWPELFLDLQRMEKEVLKVDAENRAAQAG
ncbi:DUF1799 domain-containing protein [Aquabacterium sp.]|uniref:DUF1799 domain-containing protein n=1 Tax=Aquabacterium sp. TaxID=1872578 RepID=UPI0025B8E06A|nr:DUF1799 domain-containing protein [Aquabacterium sp.]